MRTMQGTFFNCLISVVAGAVSAVGTVWYLSDASRVPTAQTPSSANIAAEEPSSLEVTDLVVTGRILVVDPETQTATIELNAGTIVAQQGVYAEKVSAFRILGQKLQATPDSPLDSNSAVFGELAVNEDGGAYIELLSPRESHSVTVGFDRDEKGCILSQNNDDSSMVAQAIFLKPRAEDSQTVAAQRPTQETTNVETVVNDDASAVKSAENVAEKPNDVARE